MKNSSSSSVYLRAILSAAVLFLALSSGSRAVDPPPDGGYPNENTAEGEDALFKLSTGIHNTGLGYHALYSTTNGRNNTAIGWEAMERNTVGYKNVATGCDALHLNTIGFGNAAYGDGALKSNISGSNNTSSGFESLNTNTTGSNNTASGQGALQFNTTGSSNIALGVAAGANLTTGSNNIDIGNAGIAAESNTIRLGTIGTHAAAFIAGVSGSTVAEGVGVIVDGNGQMGTIVSSERFKDNIGPMGKASEAILSLKPVTFRYKHELDPKGVPQFGLVAEEVEKINPELVAHDGEGRPYTVRYEAVNAMLLNEFLKAHRKIEEQEADIAQLKATVKGLVTSFRDQNSGRGR